MPKVDKSSVEGALFAMGLGSTAAVPTQEVAETPQVAATPEPISSSVEYKIPEVAAGTDAQPVIKYKKQIVTPQGKIRKGIWLTPETDKAIDIRAAEMGMSKSDTCELALKFFLEKYDSTTS